MVSRGELFDNQPELEGVVRKYRCAGARVLVLGSVLPMFACERVKGGENLPAGRNPLLVEKSGAQRQMVTGPVLIPM